MRLLRTVLILIAAGIAALWFGARHEAEPQTSLEVDDRSNAVAQGAAAFVSEDFGGLSLAALDSHALPWKLVAAALVLDTPDDVPVQVTHDALRERLNSFGFLAEPRILNLPNGVQQRPSGRPFGMTYGVIEPVAGATLQVSNLGCAACHAGVTYDETGAPLPGTVWLGMPNTSLNLEAYTLAVTSALRAGLADPDRLLEAVATLFPETMWREAQTLRWLVLPLVRSRLENLASGRPLPFPNGVPGSTNGVAALKHALGLPLLGGGPGDAGIVSIPDLGHRHWKTSLLTDGAYAVPGRPRQFAMGQAEATTDHLAALAEITTFFTVPSMGVAPEDASEALPQAMEIYAFLSNGYHPQPFPGTLDEEIARRGAEVYESECSACHGSHDTTSGAPRLTQLPNWIGDVGTDALRVDAFDDALVASFDRGAYANRISALNTDKYVAPPLTGIWASAPYLHNGSVPTIAELLSPNERPVTFEVGGHALDFERLGLRHNAGNYPVGYTPFSDPVVFDTREPGKENTGHAFGASLPPEDKRALIEFLKQL
ncbi:MAG: hypothetical protein AAGA06_00635 [Pseudomonadota bacterium]